ncbi:MAG: HflC protein [Planctomycetaceae bacterium]|nr:HflC protein [Planctomycetaceae bacterium]
MALRPSGPTNSEEIMSTDDQQSVAKSAMRQIALLAGVVAAACILWSCVVFVDETEFVISERLGKIAAVYDRDEDRGLHFKLPWPIETIRRFDRRTQLFDPYGREVFTKDKKNVIVDTYICWRIADSSGESADFAKRPVVRFFRSLGGKELAETRLDSRVRSILSTQIGQVELDRLFQIENSEQAPVGEPANSLKTLSANVRELVIQRPNEAESIRDRLGIEIIDIRIKRLNFPSGNQQAVFERMKSERQKIAQRERSAGNAESQVLRSHADRQYNEILARANADAERIRGEADAESISILNAAHSQDRQLYKMLRALDSYEKIINERTTLVLSANSNLLRLLTEGLEGFELDQPIDADERSTQTNEVRPPLKNAAQSNTDAATSKPDSSREVSP